MTDQADAFLLIQSANDGNKGFVSLIKPKPVTEGLFVCVLLIERLDRITLCDEGIDLRVPNIVVHTVQYSSEFSMMLLQGPLESAAEIRVLDLFRVAGRNGGHKVGEDDPSFHQIYGVVVEIILQPVLRFVMSRIQSYLAKDGFTRHSLMPDIMQSIADPRMIHSPVLVHFE